MYFSSNNICKIFEYKTKYFHSNISCKAYETINKKNLKKWQMYNNYLLLIINMQNISTFIQQDIKLSNIHKIISSILLFLFYSLKKTSIIKEFTSEKWVLLMLWSLCPKNWYKSSLQAIPLIISLHKSFSPSRLSLSIVLSFFLFIFIISYRHKHSRQVNLIEFNTTSNLISYSSVSPTYC